MPENSLAPGSQDTDERSPAVPSARPEDGNASSQRVATSPPEDAAKGLRGEPMADAGSTRQSCLLGSFQLEEKSTATAKARASGRRLLVLNNGSRGDAQPVAALVLGLKSAGFVVKVLTNENHVELLRSMDVDAAGVNVDLEKLLKDNPFWQELVEKGDDASLFRKAVDNVWDGLRKSFPDTLARKIKETKEFKPDVILNCGLDGFEAFSIACAMGVPVVSAALQMPCNSRDFQASTLRRPRWFPHNTVGTLILQAIWSAEHAGKAEELVRQLPESEEFIARTKGECMLLMHHPITPILIGYSPSLYAMPRDWSADMRGRARITGFWIVPLAAQESKLRGGDPLFGGSDRERLEAFLKQGDPPVYLGWGSMVDGSPEHMAGLAIGALMRAKLRGVVLGGWAGLEASLLHGQPDGEALTAYAAKSVLFARTAAHEWLFPQCKVLVHHGGSGTSAAAVRSGVPSVVMPCAFDQFDNARLLEVKGAGVALKRFSQVTVADLATAITRCSTDQKLIASTQRMGERLRSEDGVDSAVRALDDFIVEELDTGRWRANLQDRLDELREMRTHPRRCCTTGRWLGQMFCSSRPNEYSVAAPKGKMSA